MVWAYCLMPNHVHFVAVPQRPDSLALALHDAHTVYAMHFNTKTEMSGHVWQGRFYSCPLDEPHLWAAVRYVERNPVRAGIVERAEQYGWSSAAAHCGFRHDALLSTDYPPSGVIPNWPEWLVDDRDEDIERIRKQTHSGRPCGSADFVEHLESLLNRLLRQRKRGRPKGVKNRKKESDLQACP